MMKHVPFRIFPISLGKNIIFNVSGYCVSVLVTFLITPLIIHTLGNVRYGAWSLVSELIGYYGLLDLGIRGAVTYYVAQYSARNRGLELKETISSAFWLLSGCGVAAFSVGLILAIVFPRIFQTDVLILTESRQALIIMSALIGLSLPMNAFTAGLVGKERFDITSGTEILNRLLTSTLIWISLKFGGGLVDLALIHAAGRLVYWIITLTACRRTLGGIFIRPIWLKTERVKALFGYGFRNAIGQLAQLIIYRIDLLVVGMFVGIEQVTFYAIGSALISYASSLCTSITYTFTPRFTQLYSANADNQLKQLYFRSMRITGMMVTGLVAGILVFGNGFITLWLGSSYVNGPWTRRSDIVMTILILANMPLMMQSISRQLLYAMARVRFLMWLGIVEAIANLLLSLVLVRYYGPAGVAMGTLFPLLATHVLVMPIYMAQVLKISVSMFVGKCIAIPLTTGTVIGIMGILMIQLISPTNWTCLFLSVSVTLVISAPFCFVIGFTREERISQFCRLTAFFGKAILSHKSN